MVGPPARRVERRGDRYPGVKPRSVRIFSGSGMAGGKVWLASLMFDWLCKWCCHPHASQLSANLFRCLPHRDHRAADIGADSFVARILRRYFVVVAVLGYWDVSLMVSECGAIRWGSVARNRLVF